MHVPFSSLAVAIALMAGGTIVFGAGGASADSISERICIEGEGTWDKTTKTCFYPVEETRPGDNKGNASWETEESDTAHGNLKNDKSTHDESCEGPGDSESHC
jgi:hypothetical protein